MPWQNVTDWQNVINCKESGLALWGPYGKHLGQYFHEVRELPLLLAIWQADEQLVTGQQPDTAPVHFQALWGRLQNWVAGGCQLCIPHAQVSASSARL